MKGDINEKELFQMEHEIRQLINEIVGGKYVGKLKVSEDKMENSSFWTLMLYLDTEMTPLILAYEGTLDEFKTFIAEELKMRKLHNIKF